MKTTDIYTLDLTFSFLREKDSSLQTIKLALNSWKEIYGTDYVNFLEREVVVWKIFWIISIYNKNILANLPEELMRQILWVLWKKFYSDKYVYEVDLIP